MSSFFIRKSLFNGLFQHNLTKAGSAVIKIGHGKAFSIFLLLYYLTKGREGVHFRQGGVHILIIPKNNKKPQDLLIKTWVVLWLCYFTILTLVPLP